VASFKNPGSCGNGSVDAPGETCDPPGAVCASDGRVCGSTCTCPAPKCGDGIVNQAGEQCDDGDTDSGDGCSATCQTEAPVCGNDVRQGIEECDGTDDGTCPGGCVNCECLVSPPCPPLWQTVTDPTAGDVCVLPCAAGTCPAPFSCLPNGLCLQQCGAAPICGGACPAAKQCAPSGDGGCACFFQN
jgi:cysteine-rich repeat protein